MPPTNHLINILPSEEDWKQAAKKWHRQLLKMPVLAMDSIKYLTGLPGCRQLFPDGLRAVVLHFCSIPVYLVHVGNPVLFVLVIASFAVSL